MNITKSIVLLTLLSSFPALADISVGYLSILSDSPTNGDLALTITNLTGPGNCSSFGPPYSACSNLDFTNWTLTVNYTSTYYNGSGPTEPSPFVYTSATYGDITPGSTNNVFPFDLCGGAGSCASPITSITSVLFTGQISPSSFCLYDPSALGCGSPPTTFFANPNFDLTWDAGSSLGGPYVDENSVFYAQSPDITVTTQSTVGVTPEPNEFFPVVGLAALLSFAWFARRRNRPA